MNRLILIPALVGLLIVGCQKPAAPESTAAEKALAVRIAALEEKVDRLRQLLVAVDRRKPPVVTPPRTVVVANTNATLRAQEEHLRYEQVMQSLAEAVESIQQQEQGMAERQQSITDAIISLEQAVLSLDAELRQLRLPR